MGIGSINLANVQRLFSSFPSGAAGIALLVFRASIAASLSTDGYLHWPSSMPFLLTAALLVLGVFLVFGFVTPYTSTCCLLIELGILTIHPAADEYHVAHLVVNCGVLAILGPGAYSIDARLFGRRVLNIPRRR